MIDFAEYIAQTAHYREAQRQGKPAAEGRIDGMFYRLFRPDAGVDEVILLWHGGGVSGDAGYDVLAQRLASSPGVAVCLVDIRGHGASTGARGTVAETRQIWQDVGRLMREMRRLFPDAHQHLLGHSSGAGMLLNALTRYPGLPPADSVIMLAPELGPFSATARKDAPRFARVRQWPFILHALSGGRLCGQRWAVSLTFPADLAETTTGFVRHYSVTMANALTPRHPAKQLAALTLPTLLLVASEDALICPRLLTGFAAAHGHRDLRVEPLTASGHLTCVLHAADAVLGHLAARRRERAV